MTRARPFAGPIALALCAVPIAAALAGCSRRAPTATPQGAVRELVERMRTRSGDPADDKVAFELLSKRAQDNLTTRAQRYSAATGKTIAPEAMIVPARFGLRFEPQSFTEQIVGIHALVHVMGASADRSADVPCVYEDGGWRVDLTLPPLPPLQTRPGVQQP